MPKDYSDTHVLVVDDEEIIRTTLESILIRHKMQISKAGTTNEALDQLGEW